MVYNKQHISGSKPGWNSINRHLTPHYGLLISSLTAFLFLTCLCTPSISLCAPGDVVKSSISAQDKAQKTIAKLLKTAKENLGNGHLDEAATALYEIYLNFPDAPQAEDALWRTAKLREKIASNKLDADFEQVRDLYRSYINYFPRSARVPEAYLKLGVSYYHMHFYREALSYIKLFMKKYRDSPLILQAKRWKGKTLIKIGRELDAEELFRAMSRDKDLANRAVGIIGMGDVRYEQGKYRQAKDFYQSVLLAQPEYYLSYPDLLRKAGMADIKVGKIARGRQELYHYLSLAQGIEKRSEVLADLADSYYLSGDYQVAANLFELVVKNSVPGGREMLLANLRLAQYRDGTTFKKSKWDKPQDLTDVNGDKPYLAVLDSHYRGAMSQEARYGLFMRYKVRKDLTGAYDIGRSFLRNSTDHKVGSVESKRAGDILLYLSREFLREKKYQKIYDLYFVDYRHLQDFPDGRLLYLVGQAMEGLGLYDQAAVVYYRALKWPLPEADKTDLYFRRAHVYLLKKDYAAADRLLTYLRKIYKDTSNIGEVLFYSGKLAEANNDRKGALDYYQQAVFSHTFLGKMNEYVSHAVGLALKLGYNDRAYEIWQQARHGGGLNQTDSQEWALKIANAFRNSRLWSKAVEVYKGCLAQEFPQKGRSAQFCNLYLGDSLLGLGNKSDGIVFYQKAEAGQDETIKKMASERLRQADISTQVSEMKKVIGK